MDVLPGTYAMTKIFAYKGKKWQISKNILGTDTTIRPLRICESDIEYSMKYENGMSLKWINT
jgi:hypothetical protein